MISVTLFVFLKINLLRSAGQVLGVSVVNPNAGVTLTLGIISRDKGALSLHLAISLLGVIKRKSALKH